MTDLKVLRLLELVQTGYCFFDTIFFRSALFVIGVAKDTLDGEGPIICGQQDKISSNMCNFVVFLSYFKLAASFPGIADKDGSHTSATIPGSSNNKNGFLTS